MVGIISGVFDAVHSKPAVYDLAGKETQPESHSTEAYEIMMMQNVQMHMMLKTDTTLIFNR